MYEKRKQPKNLPASVKRNIHFNVQSERYEMTENGITYHLTHAQLAAMKQYAVEFRDYSVEKWYNKLNRIDKKAIWKTGDEKPPVKYSDGNFFD